MWIGVLWAGLRVAMWITHVGGQISPWPARKVTEQRFPCMAHIDRTLESKMEGQEVKGWQSGPETSVRVQKHVAVEDASKV